VTTFCVQILLYSVESITWNQKMLKSIENAFSQAFMIFFRTFDSKVVEYCQYAMGYLPMKLSIDVRKLFYLSKLNNLHCEPIYRILSVNEHELLNICSKHKYPGNVKHCNWKHSRLCGNILNLMWNAELWI